MSSFLGTSSCQKLKTKCLSGTLYNKEDKEVLVTKLKTEISKLEQEDKDYESLNEEYKQLENDVNLLIQAKLRLEYESKQREESYKKRLSDLQSENENLKNALSDKLCVNKKLFDEKQCLQNQLKTKKDEITELTNKLNSLNNRMNTSENDKNILQNSIDELNNVKETQKNKIAELVDDNKKLVKLCQDQDHSLYICNQDKANLNNKLNEDNATINNLNSKIRIYSTNLNNLQNNIDKSNELNSKLNKDLQSLEQTYNEFQIDQQNMIDELNKQHIIRQNEEKNNNEMRKILCEQKNKLQCLNKDYSCLNNMHNKKRCESDMYQIENGQLEEHMVILTKQNDELSDEINNIIKDDNQMANILNRTDRMSTMLKTNDNIISQMPYRENCYQTYKSQMYPDCDIMNNRMNFSQGFERRRCMSPNSKYTYSRLENTNKY